MNVEQNARGFPQNVPGGTKLMGLLLVVCFIMGGFVLRAELPPITSAVATTNGGSNSHNEQAVVPNAVTQEQYYSRMRDRPAYVLAINPGFYWRVWTIFTAGFFEISILSFIFSLVLVAIIGSQIEILWGTHEFLRFAAIVTFVPYSIVWPLVTFFSPVARSAPNVCGVMPLLVGFSVALKQLDPNKVMNMLFVYTMPMKYLPLVMVVCSLIFGLLGTLWMFPLSVMGMILAWAYLRFWQSHGQSALKGDLSEQFCFADFFPEPLRGFVSRIETGSRPSSSSSSTHAPPPAQVI
ncbi:transmembrane protein [Pelomyxa schiedti]|nr:transmembrane protein [Pelomyxa schiedti]